MVLPNNETLSAIFGNKALGSRMIDETNAVINVVGRGSVKVNIYELMHLCKEQAWNNGYTLRPHKRGRNLYVCKVGFGTDKTATQFVRNTEPEAVFRACEYTADKTQEETKGTIMKTREEKVEALINQDIESIKEGMFNEDFEFLNSVLSGEGWKPYNQLTDKEVETEYRDRIESQNA